MVFAQKFIVLLAEFIYKKNNSYLRKISKGSDPFLCTSYLLPQFSIHKGDTDILFYTSKHTESDKIHTQTDTYIHM